MTTGYQWIDMMESLDRFLNAQAPVYEAALFELKSGRKESHWMWFVLPQLKALGRSSMAKMYGLQDLSEARSYWSHPVLGPRLKACILSVLSLPPRTAHEIFGTPDDIKFRSCLTLFEAATSEACFAEALERFYAGRRDPATLALTAPDD